MGREVFWIDALPDSVWGQLPGGPSAYNLDLDEAWQYMGSVRHDEYVWHEFRHRAHPQLDDARVNAYVVDGDAGPRLGRLFANNQELALGDVDSWEMA